MNRGDQRILEGVRRLDRVIAVHGEVERPARPRRAREGDDEARPVAPRDLGDAFAPDRVAADVDRVARPVEANQKTDDVARDWLDPNRAMAGRRLGDMELRAIGPSDFNVFPGREAPRDAEPFGGEPSGADTRRQDDRRLGEEPPPGGVEIVGVLIMRGPCVLRSVTGPD